MTWGESAGWQGSYWHAAYWFGPQQAVSPTPVYPSSGYGGGTAGGGGGTHHTTHAKSGRESSVEFVFRDGQWVFSRVVKNSDDADLLAIAQLFMLSRKP